LNFNRLRICQNISFFTESPQNWQALTSWNLLFWIGGHANLIGFALSFQTDHFGAVGEIAAINTASGY